MNATEEVRLIWADPNNNHNKMWHGTLFDNGDVKVEWGRVGYKTQSKIHHVAGANKLHTLERQKLKKGYVPQRTVNGTTASAPSTSLKEAVTRDISCTKPEIRKLVQWLAEVNIHNIVSNTNITYDTSTGAFTTPLGLVTLDGIQDARILLDDISPFVMDNDLDNEVLKQKVAEFCNIVPQNVGMRRGWHKVLFNGQKSLVQQNDILDSLEASLQQARTTPDNGKHERVFDVELDLIEDSKVIGKVRDVYNRTKGRHRDVASLDVKRVYSVNLPSVAKSFAKDGKKVGNIRNLWHGTSSANLLSIFKVGLIIPPARSGHVTGRAFGHGLYFSEMSSKSLRYSTGAWGQRSNGRFFMFLCDVAMGKPYITTSLMQTQKEAPRGYDSVWCKPGTVFRNDEQIVYRTSQANLNYLIEFG